MQTCEIKLITFDTAMKQDYFMIEKNKHKENTFIVYYIYSA